MKSILEGIAQISEVKNAYLTITNIQKPWQINETEYFSMDSHHRMVKW